MSPLHAKKMIFYDKKQKRKKKFRFTLIFLLVFIISLTTNLAVGIANTPVNKIELDQDYYFNNNDKKLALTFDDGPHEENTQKILAILKKNKVPATFFLLGQNIIGNQDIVKAIDKAGMEIGNHSFTHSKRVHRSPRKIRWELNSTSRLIEEVTGKPATLYRPPYLMDIGSDPIYLADDHSRALRWIKNAGYITVGADIDPKDWLSKSGEEVAQNLDKVIDNGHIILLHDGGGDQRNIINSLDSIIKKYKSEGYQFVTVSNVLGLEKEKFIPYASSALFSSARHNLDLLYLKFLSFVGLSFFVLMLKIVVLLSFFRLIMVLILFSISKIKKRKIQSKLNILNRSSELLTVSVVVPAYNEEAGIEATLNSILKNTRLPDEIIVVNDGSNDKTSEIVKSIQSEHGNLIKLIELENGGKARALNYAFSVSSCEIIIAMDGDSIFDKNVIRSILKHFSNPLVGAVAGKVVPVTPRNYLGAFQSIEYIVGQNIEKAGLNIINSVGVVPGPIGAWKRELVNKLGGYSTDTLVEDQDLTLAILADGQKIIYEPTAICYTETPVTVKDFAKQRFRWIFGTMQCFWKYKFNLLRIKRKNLGLVVMPNILLYNTFLPLFSPIIDILTILALLSGSWLEVLAAYNLFTLFDLIYASLAFFKGEKKNLHLLMVLPLQRIFYRQILYVIVIRSIIKAIEGTSTLWNKVERNGNLQKFYAKLYKPA